MGVIERCILGVIEGLNPKLYGLSGLDCGSLVSGAGWQGGA